MKYTLKIYMSKYMQIGEKWETFEASRSFKFKDWDDVQNTIAYLTEGADGSVKFELDKED